MVPSTKEYEDFNEHSVLCDSLSGRPINITSKDPKDSEFNVPRSILLSESEVVEKLAKFRAYRRRIDSLSRKVLESQKVLNNLDRIGRTLKMNLDFFISKDKFLEYEDFYDVKSRLSVNKERIYLSELKRIQNLVSILRIRGLLCELGIVGGEVSDDLRGFLKNSSSESMKLVKLRYFPLIIRLL